MATGRKAASPDVPEWVTTTPRGHSHTLDLYDACGGSIQGIELTRAEFIALKRASGPDARASEIR